MKNKLYIFLGIAFIALIFHLGSWGLTDSSEARYAEISKEMYVSGDYINPTLLGIKHLHKPPVTYYITAFSYHIFGANEFAARFFMQVALVVQIYLVFQITLLLYKNEKLAFAAALIYFTFPITIIAVRTLTTDAYLTTFILASIYFWIKYKHVSKPYFLYLFYLFLGLIFETKGPVGFIIPITFIITHKIIYKEKIETTIHQFLGILLFIFIAASWYIVVVIHNEGLVDYFFNNQLIERVSKNKFNRGKPIWYYALILPVIGLPWVIYLFFYFKKHLKAIVKKQQTNFILIITFLVLFLVLTVSTSKLILYILPLFFILAIFSAKYLKECSEKQLQLFSIIYLILIFLFTFPIIAIKYSNFQINVNLGLAILTAIFFTSIGLFMYKKIKNSNYLKPAYLGVVFIIAVLITSNQLFSINESKINSVKPISKFIQENSNKNAQVLVYNYLLPSLSFYLNQNITTINHGKYTTQREIQFETNEDWKENLINYFNLNDRARILEVNTAKPTFLIKKKSETLPDTLKILTDKLKHKKDFNTFEVYY